MSNVIDVIVVTHSNPVWLARCLASLLQYVPGDQEHRIHIENDREQRSFISNVRKGLDDSPSEIVFVIQDDAQLMCLRPSWLQELLTPFTRDPFVAVSCMTATSVGYPHQSVRLAMPPGAYYTSMFIPIAFAARRDALRMSLEGIEHDILCDHEPSLRLMMAGYKIVMNTHLPVYHEGMQSNLRVYGGSDPKKWMDEAKEKTIETIRRKYPPIWIQRLESLEMIPMQNFLAKTEKGMEVRI